MKIASFRKDRHRKSYSASELPKLDPSEQILAEGRPRIFGFLVFGVVLTFIPPFVCGPLLIWYGIVHAKRSRTFFTERRIFQVQYWVGSNVEVTEFELPAFCGILPIPNPINVFRRAFFGESKLGLGYRDEDGTMRYTRQRIFGDGIFINRLKEHLKKNDAKRPNQAMRGTAAHSDA